METPSTDRLPEQESIQGAFENVRADLQCLRRASGEERHPDLEAVLEQSRRIAELTFTPGSSKEAFYRAFIEYLVALNGLLRDEAFWHRLPTRLRPEDWEIDMCQQQLDILLDPHHPDNTEAGRHYLQEMVEAAEKGLAGIETADLKAGLLRRAQRLESVLDEYQRPLRGVGRA